MTAACLAAGGVCCVGFEACVWDGSVTVGLGSCMGASACFGYSRADGRIGAGSCTGDAACLFASGNIGNGSCTAEYACFYGKSEIPDVNITDNNKIK